MERLLQMGGMGGMGQVSSIATYNNILLCHVIKSRARFSVELQDNCIAISLYQSLLSLSLSLSLSADSLHQVWTLLSWTLLRLCTSLHWLCSK